MAIARLFEQAATRPLLAGLFDLSTIREADREWAARVMQTVVDNCDFSYSRLVEPMNRKVRKTAIRVRVTKLDADTNAEVDTVAATISINSDMLPGAPHSKPVRTVANEAIGELGHLVDEYLLTDEQRGEIYEALDGPKNLTGDFGVDEWFRASDYWARGGEAFMAVFIYAYSNFTPDQSSFKLTARPKVGVLLRILLGDGPEG